MTERDFVLFPLVDIAGSKLLLPNGEELGKLVAACPEAGAQRTRLSLSASAGNVPGESDCSRAPVTGPDAGDQGH
jgi:2-amino-4-hydroxy-6-hydroxymethyldihydropteridine diphosphokinase